METSELMYLIEDGVNPEYKDAADWAEYLDWCGKLDESTEEIG